MTCKNKYLCAIIMYEFRKGTKIVDVEKSICDVFGEATVDLNV